MSLFPLPLVLPHHTHYARLGVGPEATAEEIRAAAARLDARLKARNAGVQEMVEAHAINLESAAARAEHDDDHPPLALMRLESTWAPVFEERAVGLAVLRRELERFLESRGERVYRPSDLTRADFSADHTYCPMLDD
ncbi:hypothetical protein [Nonomuraea dietziae]|uniref:Uncharacterized protein n=1 Tax=Nonomuraea dietziae TaxID=65515 RepID=A0A7W5V043_9ACTN|nr:hypothetical protein [Nonomuraea dietziae]MBB3727887.1 hypothetical protein [Nonomuraea dietziae]